MKSGSDRAGSLFLISGVIVFSQSAALLSDCWGPVLEEAPVFCWDCTAWDVFTHAAIRNVSSETVNVSLVVTLVKLLVTVLPSGLIVP